MIQLPSYFSEITKKVDVIDYCRFRSTCMYELINYKELMIVMETVRLLLTLFCCNQQQYFSLTQISTSYQPTNSTFLSQQISISHKPQLAEQSEYL